MPYAKKDHLQSAWIQFAESGQEEQRLDCGSPQAARRMRFALYAAARPVKKRPELNLKLAQAVEQVALRIDEKEPNVLVMYREEFSPLVQILVQQMGLDLGKKEADFRQAAAESAQRVLAQVGVAPMTPRTTPYYTRERPRLDGNAPTPTVLPLPPGLMEGEQS